MTDLNNFRYQPFVTVSGNPGVKVPVVDDVLSSHEHEIYPTISRLCSSKTALSLNFKQIATFTWICDKHILL